MILNLGAGTYPRPDATNVDVVALPGIDVVHDLDVLPWPFRAGEADEIRAIQLFEHVKDPIGFMCESWRVLKLGGVLILHVPHYQSRNAFTDPTHRRFCTEETWDYWIRGRHLWKQFGPMYGGHRCPYEAIRIERILDDLQVELRKSEP
jgi:SAM-dependent methyltransferase